MHGINQLIQRGASPRAFLDTLKSLRAIEAFLREWDPLGAISNVHEGGDVSDESDSYAPTIHGMLGRGCGVEDLAAHLMRVESESMGVSAAAERDRAVALRILEWWEGR